MGRLRTKAGIILEKLLHENKHRYLWCWNGERDDSLESPYDCACCITWSDEDLYARCGCICHERIEEMAAIPHIRLWLLAAEAMDELPPFFTSYAEKLTYSKKLAVEHAAYPKSPFAWMSNPHDTCECEFCGFVKDDVNRKFPIEGEDNSRVTENMPAKPVKAAKPINCDDYCSNCGSQLTTSEVSHGTLCVKCEPIKGTTP